MGSTALKLLRTGMDLDGWVLILFTLVPRVDTLVDFTNQCQSGS
jgi:hypothetical protein